MRVISKAVLVEFWRKHPASRHALQTWFEDASHAQWKSPQEIKTRYASASFVGTNRVVFNIKGNDYRLVVAVAYRFAALYIKFVGTHAQYDMIDAATVENHS
ncbi:MAG: type II toxin-antitoxin system HigB family toxin [Hylemonella sp.]|nr:type II toxin-antitoxin system HigB family toxin [Hylemonella sp.]